MTPVTLMPQNNIVSSAFIKTVDGSFILHPVHELDSVLEAFSNIGMFHLLSMTRFSVLACFPIECGWSVRNCDATNKPTATDSTF